MIKRMIILTLVVCTASVGHAALSGVWEGYTLTISGSINRDLYLIVASNAVLSPLDDSALGPAAPDCSSYGGGVHCLDGGLGSLLGLGCETPGGVWALATCTRMFPLIPTFLPGRFAR